MITLAALAAYCGADEVRDADALVDALGVGMALVDNALSNTYRQVPEFIVDTCYKRAAYAEFQLNKTTDSGTYSMADGNTAPVVANDPMRKVWPLLKPYLNRLGA